jgi:hypothetical protein
MNSEEYEKEANTTLEAGGADTAQAGFALTYATLALMVETRKMRQSIERIENLAEKGMFR